jgi:hypothetical protein
MAKLIKSIPRLKVKWNFLWKYASHRKISMVAMPGLKCRDHYFLKINVHVINENLYFVTCVETMLQKNVDGAIIERRKIVFHSNALIFHLLNHGCPMIEYFAMQFFFVKLNVFNNPKNINLMG